MNWIGTKTSGCRHLAEFPIDEILTHRTWEPNKEVFIVDGRRIKVHMDSIRYHVFARSRTCACCDRVGTRMMLDVHGQIYSRAHFNLYAEVNDKLILMTKDHIIPRSKGGNDNLDNLQTLCTKCNNRKNDKIVNINTLRELVTT